MSLPPSPDLRVRSEAGLALEPCLSRKEAGPALSGPHNYSESLDHPGLLTLLTCRPPGYVCLSVTRHLLSLLAEVRRQSKT